MVKRYIKYVFTQWSGSRTFSVEAETRPIAQLKTEQVNTEVKIRVTPELPFFLVLQDRDFESIFFAVFAA